MGKPDQPRGPDGKWIKRPGTVAAGAALAVAVAYGPVGVSGGGGAVSVESGMGKVLRGKLDKGKRSAAKGNRGATFRELELKPIRQQLRKGGHCAAHAYGEVRRYFLRVRCRSLERMLFLLGDGNGNRIVVSVSWVEMNRTGQARELRGLADVHGTGNVSPLPGALVGTGRIDWSGRYYDSRISGRLVVIAEVEPVRGDPSAEYMDGVAEVVATFPRP